MSNPVIPYVPETITVHLGPPDSAAANVTVPFIDYVKNVASSEIYPTWGESALRANVYAIVSFALNRVYTEFYRSRGYDFDITSSTAYDQFFVPGRSYYSTIERIVDSQFNDYIRRIGFVEPLAAKFCNGTTVTCDGLSQWGSQRLSEQGYSAMQILRYYYGDNIELVTNAPVRGVTPSYPGTALRRGSAGPAVQQVQVSLNRIAQNFPAIPRIDSIDAIYGPTTENAVRRFQEIFDLEPDGIVGPATWYTLVRLYVAVTRLAELRSEGQQFYENMGQYPGVLALDSTGPDVTQLQYMLALAASFVPGIGYVPRTGTYDLATQQAVQAFQRYAGLTESGVVGALTWNALRNQIAGIENAVPAG